MFRAISSGWERMRFRINEVVDNGKELFAKTTCIFSEQELANYEILTYLTSPDILRICRRFEKIMGEEFREDDRNPSVEISKILQTRELCNNPFKDRIVMVFAYTKSSMSFDEYMNMMSVFSNDAPLKVKAEYAFKMYDFNHDNLFCKDDLKELINRLRGTNPMKDWIFEEVAAMIITEADIDGDGYLNFAEFEHTLSKNEEFLNSFKMKI